MIIKNWKHYIAQIVFYFFLIFITNSCSDYDTNDKGIMWKINGSTNKIYLILDTHFFSSNDYPLSKKINDAYKNSMVIVFEVDYDSLDLPESQDEYFNNSLLKNEKTFKENVSKELFDFASEKARVFGYDINNWKIRPLYLASFLFYNQLNEIGCEFEYQINGYFLEKAKEDNKKIKTLGTVKLYHPEYNEITLKEEETHLLNTLNEMNNLNKEKTIVKKFWEEGDFYDLEKYYLDKRFDLPKSLLSNYEKIAKIFIKRIETFLSEKDNHFIIIPIEYMIGKSGIVRLMKDNGFELISI